MCCKTIESLQESLNIIIPHDHIHVHSGKGGSLPPGQSVISSLLPVQNYNNTHTVIRLSYDITIPIIKSVDLY